MAENAEGISGKTSKRTNGTIVKKLIKEVVEEMLVKLLQEIVEKPVKSW